MAIIDFQGWEMGMDLPTISGSNWSYFGNMASQMVSGTGARTGDWAVEVAIVNSTGRGGIRRALTTAEESNTLVAGVGFSRHGGNAAALAAPLFEFASDNNATVHIVIVCLANGQFEIRRGDYYGTNTLLATSSDPQPIGYNVNTYRYVEAKVVLDDVAGSVVLSVDKKVWLNLTNIDTRNGGTKTVFDSASLGRPPDSLYWSRHRYDDLYLLNGDTSGPVDPFGGVAIHNLKPTANGASSQFVNSAGTSTNNFDYVNDTGGTDYVQSATPGARDLWVAGDLPATITGGVQGVKLVAHVKNTDGSLRNLKLGTKQGVTVDMDAGQTIGGGSAQGIQRTMVINPVTGLPWTPTDVNGMEMGAEVV